jgi:hypothetical protein
MSSPVTNQPFTPALSSTSSDPSPALSSFDPLVTPSSVHPSADDAVILPELRLDDELEGIEWAESTKDDKVNVVKDIRTQVEGTNRFPECWAHRGASSAFRELGGGGSTFPP